MTCIRSSHLKDRVSVRVANRGEIIPSEHLGQGIRPSGLFLDQRYDTPLVVLSSSLSVTEFFVYK